MKFVLILGSLVISVWCCTEPQTILIEKDWWETAQFYQIYPRSFQDSNGDGIGDLNGITSRLEYLKDIGITATWLSPIYKSPMADFGYDISDFYDIHPDYGTMEDFDKLIERAKELGIKIILDFVPNHSSDENEWFIKSVNRVKGYEDFYVWHSGKPDPDNSTNRLPPSNWLQAFRGSAWKWNDKRQQFYLHQFAEKQPDLNYRNPAVVEQMKHVLRFWLGKGVSGFRVDAVPWCFEVVPDANGNYPDEPKSGFTDDPDEAAYLNHIYTQDQPETVDMVYQWRQLLDDFKRIHGGDTRVLLTETYSRIDEVMKFYGNGIVKGAQIPFNFNFILMANKMSTAKDLDNIISLWLSKMPSGNTPNWVLGNHDQRRVGSRYGKERIDIMNMILMMLPGVSITYNGEEIGMLDVDISWDDSVDPAACNSNPDIYEKFSRDPARTPFQWDDTKNAGFSTGQHTWLPISDNYKTINVKTESQNERSHLSVFKQLVNLRQNDILKLGTLKHSVLNDDILVIQRYLEEEKPIVLVVNFGSNSKTVDLGFTEIPTELNVKIISEASNHKLRDKVKTASIDLEPYEGIILGV